MNEFAQTAVVIIAVLAAAGTLLWRAIGRKAKSGCGCNGCPKAPTRR